MFKKMIISAALACAFCSASSAMSAWPVWDEFRNDALDNGRVVDKSDDRKVTTSEGQSYAMFFALVTNDQVTLDRRQPLRGRPHEDASRLALGQGTRRQVGHSRHQ